VSISVSILIIFICIIGEAFFSGSEIALVSVDKIRMQHQAKQGDFAAQLIVKMLKSPEKILGTTLLGTNVFTITNTTVAASVFYSLLGPPGIPVSIAVMSFVNWIFCEIVPKSIFQQLANTITPKIIYVLKFFYYLFFPVVWLFSSFANVLTRLFQNEEDQERSTFVSRNELKKMMTMTHTKSDVKPDEKQMITRMLDFNEIRVGEIFNHLSNVTAISNEASVEKAIEKFNQSKHRRLPVYDTRIDKIVGILNSFDIMAEDKNKKVKFFMRPAFYVPTTKKIASLLEELQTNGKNMAIVVDEFGGAEGIITIEDILEEVVGEIEDEYDSNRSRYRKDSSGKYYIDGHLNIDIAKDRLGLNLPEGNYETVAGMLINYFQRIPQRGETIKIKDYKFKILSATQRTIRKIVVNPIKE